MNKPHKTRLAITLFAAVFLLAMPAYAASSRFAPDTGYMAQDITQQAPYDVYYSGGLDTVYANVSTAAAPTRAFVHEQMDLNNNMDVQLFYYDGQRSVTLFSSSVAWPQAVKKIGDKIWFSHSGGSDPGYYSVPWDETLNIYPVATATAEVITDYNWEMEEDPDGSIFVCGATSMSGGHSIGYVDEDNDNNVVTVINIGGNSSGFAVDSSGNIWSGEYLLSFTGGMHILPCRLGMWAKSVIGGKIDAIINFTPSEENPNPPDPLDWSDADVVINLGTTTITGDTTNWGPDDVEADDQGNVYISLNTYNAWNYQSEWGAVKMYSPDGEGGYTETTLGTTIQRTGIDEWDWARSLSFDGASELDDGGYTDPTQGGPTANILYLDMDLGATGNDVIDQMVAIAVAADNDSDGVPDSLDNAPETDNPGQEDTDGDGYGNICDADFNNDGNVNFFDKFILGQAFNNYNENADMNSDGSVNFFDKFYFGQRNGTSAPWY
jgi:hypothetical protein